MIILAEGCVIGTLTEQHNSGLETKTRDRPAFRLAETQRPELAVSDIEDAFEQYDIPGTDNIFFAILCLPFDLLLALLATLLDIARLIPFFYRCLHKESGDATHAIGFYANQFRLALCRIVLGPIYFAVTDPFGFALHLVDVAHWLAWTTWWSLKDLWAEFREQIDDTGRLIRLVGLQVLEVFHLVEVEASPIHSAAPRRIAPAVPAIPTGPCVRNLSVRNPRAQFVLMQPRRKVPVQVKPSALAAVPMFKPSSRTRLAPEDSPVDPDEVDDDQQLASAHKPTHSEPRSAFYGKCPSCKSEEVYAVKADGKFAKSHADFGLLVQKMYCERCITTYHRPGKLLMAPAPAIRPKDTDLYD